LITQRRCAKQRTLQIGQRVIGKGYDCQSGKIEPREGTYKGLDSKGYLQWVMEMEVPEGFSGGFVINVNGEIVGMIEELPIIKDGIAYTYVIPIFEIQQELSRAKNQLLKYVKPFHPTDLKSSHVTIEMTFQGVMLHTKMPVLNIGSSEELILNPEDNQIDMDKTNTLFLPSVAPVATRITPHELKDGDYEVRIECVRGELKIGHGGREGMDLTLKAGDAPKALQAHSLITIGDSSFRLDMTTESERRLFTNITWIATLRPLRPDLIPFFAPIVLTGSGNQVNNASEFTFGFQRDGSPEPSRNLRCPWISRKHFSLYYFENRFFFRSGWEGIPGKGVYLLDEGDSLHLLEEQMEHPLGKCGKMIALPLCYHFEEKTASLTPLPFGKTPLLPGFSPLGKEGACDCPVRAR
jgi:hypothetical protein